MKFSLPYKALLLNVGITIVILLEIIYIIRPNVEKINAVKTDIQEQLLTVDRQLEEGQTAKKTKIELENIQPFLEKVEASFLKKEDQLTFITVIEDTAIENNVTVEISLSDIPIGEGENIEIVTIPLSLTLRGTYDETLRFMMALQNIDYHINITNLSLNTQGGNTGASIIATTLRANTYWR